MKKLLKRVKQITILILTLSISGCEDNDVELPKVIAGFTYTVNTDTGTVTFINISENSRTYSWDFGDGSNSTEINPIKTYENGVYTITLEATNPAGASDMFEDEITISIPEIATLPISFDGENTNYNAETFGGASFEIVDNPDLSGSNTSASKVGAVTNIGAAFEGFFFDLGSPIDLSTQGSISINFWADSALDILMKLEEGSAAPIEATASHGGTGWETIVFSFNSSDNYSRITMFVDGPGTTAGTFYLDDITQVETPPDPCTDETEQSLDASDFNLTFQTDPTSTIGSFNAQLSYVLNPDFENDINNSCNVGQIDRDGVDLFANNQIEFDAKFDFTSNAGFKLKVWSPNAGTNVLVKLEDKTDTNINTEVGAVTSTGSAWEELTFDFPGSESNKYDKIILFFELNTNTTETYYIDDFKLYGEGSGGGGGSLVACDGGDLINDFESSDNSIFSGFGGGVGTIETNTDISVNTSANVAQYVKNAGEVFAGITIGLDSNIDFNAGVFSIDVSSQSVRQLLFKLEGLGIELIVPTSGTGWETIQYDFSSLPGNVGEVTAITLIMDNGTAGDGTGDWTIQFDNIRLCSNGDSGGGGGSLVACDGGDLINDFESSDNSIFGNFGGGAGTIEANPDTSINTSANVAQYVKNTGEVFAGITIGLDSNIDFNAGVFSIDVSSQSVRQLLFKLEGLGIELIVPTSGTGWETIQYDFSSVSGNVGAVTAITLIMDNGTAGDGTGDWTIQFDNIRLCSNGSSGGGDGPGVAAPTPPTRNVADVVSIYSDAYSDINIDNFDAGWCGGAAVTEVLVDGNNMLKKNSGIECHGIDFASNRKDLSSFTHIHFDFYTNDTNLIGDVFNVKLIDFGGGGGEASALEVNINTGTTPGIEAGVWVSVDIDITSLGGIVANNLTRSDIAQIGITTANLTNVWYDNIYLYK